MTKKELFTASAPKWYSKSIGLALELALSNEKCKSLFTDNEIFQMQIDLNQLRRFVNSAKHPLK